MIELKRVLAPADDTPFDEICSFETENYIGVYVEALPRISLPGFVVMPKRDSEFEIFCIEVTDSLELLDATVFYKTDEHITALSTSRCLDVKINENF